MVEFKGFVASKLEGYETKFAPHTALELTARGKLAFDEKIVLHSAVRPVSAFAVERNHSYGSDHGPRLGGRCERCGGSGFDVQVSAAVSNVVEWIAVA